MLHVNNLRTGASRQKWDRRSSPPRDVMSDLLAWWKLDDNENSIVVVNQLGTNAEIRGGRNTRDLYEKTPFGGGFLFDHANTEGGLDWIHLIDGVVPTGAWTVCAWVYPPDFADSSHTHVWAAGGHTTYAYVVPGGTFGFRYKSNFYNVSNAVPTNEWVHCAWMGDASEYRGYINAELVRSQALDVSDFHVSTLGRSTGGTLGSDLLIGDVRIYNRTLSPSELSTVMAARARFEPSFDIYDCTETNIWL